MTGAIVSDVLGTLGIYAWKILCAVSVLSVSNIVIRFMLHYYYEAKKKRPYAERMEAWQLGIQLSVVSAALFVITLIGSLGLVLQQSWVEQITSAFVIGQGFALRGLVECVLWGYVLRYNVDQPKNRDSDFTVMWGAEKVTGKIHKIDLMHVYLKTNNEVHAIPWTNMQQYNIK